VGAGLGLAAAMTLLDSGQNDLILAFPVLTILGSVIGYEISHHLSTPDAPGVQPMVSITSTGAALGLGGRF
jgi:hypothetical protein